MFRFIDSRRFLNISEENLANQLANRTENKYGTFKNDKNGNVIEKQESDGNFNFKVIDIGEIGAVSPKMNSILVVDEEDHILILEKLVQYHLR